jgi:hypothetical protein
MRKITQGTRGIPLVPGNGVRPWGLRTAGGRETAIHDLATDERTGGAHEEKI